MICVAIHVCRRKRHVFPYCTRESRHWYWTELPVLPSSHPPGSLWWQSRLVSQMDLQLGDVLSHQIWSFLQAQIWISLPHPLVTYPSPADGKSLNLTSLWGQPHLSPCYNHTKSNTSLLCWIIDFIKCDLKWMGQDTKCHQWSRGLVLQWTKVVAEFCSLTSHPSRPSLTIWLSTVYNMARPLCKPCTLCWRGLLRVP